ncbi:MAG TPA: S49 family peptidase [Nitrosomonas sp.]|nr:S49 family peptidase [Nitrosomonas sp.]HQX12983.1 S49 family peptidase [Nitrosomonas sp.]HRB32546.1 S49 family peptidase [Nitrosomonas sp.]HRB46201.1 S49 family peptidase [Nitrosomonas sp.]HRB78097.1 S49 family peptidase [Nitrosomonas sp.]
MNEPESKNKQENWERSLLENLALASLREQRRTRSWGIFFKILAALYLFILLFAALGWIEEGSVRLPEKHTALIEVKGVIAADTMSSAEKIVSSLQAAFKDKNTKGVVLRINSPGGSPVQAGYINDEIHRLRLKYPQIPVYAVVSDICASGGYYVAVAADKIFVDKASLVGSIGVLMDGFGFSGTLEKLGVERRLLTSGENKGFLDPFSPLDPEQKKYAQSLLKEIHEQFIQVVKQGRGERLKNDPAIFSGIVWTGEKSIELGITDAIGSAEYVAREIIQAETLVDYTPHEGFSDLFRRQRLGQVLMEFLPKSEWVIK